VVRILRGAINRTLPIKTLRTLVGKSCGTDASSVTEELKKILDHLITKGRAELVGKNVTLLKQDKVKSAALLAEAEAREPPVGAKKRKAEETNEHAYLEKLPRASATYVEAGNEEPNTGDTGTRVFLGNLSFKIDEDKLKSVIPGITHIKWITDKETHNFYGTAFVELATTRDATAAVAMAGSNILGRPVKANLAPPRPGDIWPPLVCYSTPRNDAADSGAGGGAAGGEGGSGGGGAVRAPSEKPFYECRTLFVGNLPYDVDEAKLAEFFVQCGGLAKVRWLTHKESGDFKGCGYVEFWDTEAASKGIELNGTKLVGRSLRIDWDGGGRGKAV